MKKSIFIKIFGGYFLITIILVTLVLAFSFRTIKGYHIDTLTNNLRNIGDVLRLGIVPILENERFAELNTLTKRLGKEIQTRITVIDTKGVVLADSEKDAALMENHQNRPEIIEALEGKIGRSLRFSATLKKEMLYVAMPIKTNEKILGVLRVSLFLMDINNLLGDLKRKILHIALIMVVISLLGAIAFSKNLSNPIRKLADGAQKVASGDFDVKIFLRNKDELKDLADSFNYMTEKVKTLFADSSFQKDAMNSIISSIQESLLVLDKKGGITLCNESFKKMFQDDFAAGRPCCEVLKASKVSDLIKRMSEQRRNLTEEVELNEKIFLCSASFIASKEEVVLILYDITEIKRLEKIKKDFVVNVSHELRTPLTAIKGFVETLEDELSQKHKHYLGIIKRHTDRLINIVNDLLLLSELEERKFELIKEKVNLKDLIENVIKIFDQRLKEKGLTITLDANKEPFPIKADSFKLEQMFINLIDNAIKYTEKGDIKVSLIYNGEMANIEIQDTGIGIPEKDLARIFERFYVVDKSRSRRLGGTGLGLSIVKHIALLHNGKIDVESALGVGTRFIISLPV